MRPFGPQPGRPSGVCVHCGQGVYQVPENKGAAWEDWWFADESHSAACWTEDYDGLHEVAVTPPPRI